MKKIYTIIFIMGFLLLGQDEINGLGVQGSTSNIVADKVGGLEVSFEIADDFITQDGQLKHPMFISLHQKGTTYYKTQTSINNIVLPNLNLNKGTYFLTAEIAGYFDTIQVTIQ